MQTVQVGFGKVNFPKRSTTLSAFIVEDGFKRTLVSKRFEKIGRTNVQPASEFPESDGYLYSESVKVPDGAIVCLQGSVRMNGMPVSDAGLFIRIREQGAGLLVQAALPSGGYATSHVVFSAHGDVLDIDELAGEGITPTPGYIKGYMNADEIEEVFSIRYVVPERTAAPKLEVHISDSGEEVKLNVAKPARRMRIKRST